MKESSALQGAKYEKRTATENGGAIDDIGAIDIGIANTCNA